jgi:hypothetical protein
VSTAIKQSVQVKYFSRLLFDFFAHYSAFKEHAALGLLDEAEDRAVIDKIFNQLTVL